MVPWDSEALRTPATAYAQTLWATRKKDRQLKISDTNKIVILTILVLLFGLTLLGNYFNDPYERTRKELARFYNLSLDSCTITKVSKRKYSGRGDYFVFYTDCFKDYLPILLKHPTSDNSKLFKENSTIYKDSNSIDLKIKNNGTTYNVKIRPTEPDDRPLFALIITIVYGGLITFTMISSNSKHEQKES